MIKDIQNIHIEFDGESIEFYCNGFYIGDISSKNISPEVQKELGFLSCALCGNPHYKASAFCSDSCEEAHKIKHYGRSK